jgi:hypothetical protein
MVKYRAGIGDAVPDIWMEAATERGAVEEKPIRPHRSPARNRIG